MPCPDPTCLQQPHRTCVHQATRAACNGRAEAAELQVQGIRSAVHRAVPPEALGWDTLGVVTGDTGPSSCLGPPPHGQISPPQPSPTPVWSQVTLGVPVLLGPPSPWSDPPPQLSPPGRSQPFWDPPYGLRHPGTGRCWCLPPGGTASPGWEGWRPHCLAFWCPPAPLPPRCQ